MKMYIKKHLQKISKSLKSPVIISSVITAVIVSVISVSAASVLMNPKTQVDESVSTIEPVNTQTNSLQNESSVQDSSSIDNSPVATESTPSSNNGQNTSSQAPANDVSTETPIQSTPQTTQTPTPDPLYLNTCIYISAPHENEFCPYKAPPAWNTSTVKYACGGVPCPSYNKAIQMYGSVGIATNGYTGEQWVGDATCNFVFPGSISRSINMNIDDVVSYMILNNTRLDGHIDCLTARPI